VGTVSSSAAARFASVSCKFCCCCCCCLGLVEVDVEDDGLPSFDRADDDPAVDPPLGITFRG